jgi:hypothetical protein
MGEHVDAVWLYTVAIVMVIFPDFFAPRLFFQGKTVRIIIWNIAGGVDVYSGVARTWANTRLET